MSDIEDANVPKPIFAYCEQCGQPIYGETDDEYGEEYVPLSKDAYLHYECVREWANERKKEAR